ncbi:MAG: hypothetical protein IH987_02415 [Planctomycetes bacterium]|nr:hypothetical protein [Planctomycetota bacterium]
MNSNDYLKNLDRWQAGSDPRLQDRKPEDLFSPEFAACYIELHQDLYQRIIHLHESILTLDRLGEFPFDSLYGHIVGEFWRLAWANFSEMAILLMHGLVTDHTREANTLPRLRNKIAIASNWRDDSLREVFRDSVRIRKFDKTEKEVQERITRLRNERIAHRLVDWRTRSPKQPMPGVTLKELRKVFDKMHDLFGALSFGSSYVTLMGDYVPGTVGSKPTRTSLDDVLDAVARDSDFVNQPERRGQWWPIDREHMAPEELRTMNELGKRVGLPEA